MDPVTLCITDGQIIVRVAICKRESRKMVEGDVANGLARNHMQMQMQCSVLQP